MNKDKDSLESRILKLNRKIEEDKKTLDDHMGELTAITLELQASRLDRDYEINVKENPVD